MLVEARAGDDADAPREWEPWERELYCDSFDGGAVPRVGGEGAEAGTKCRLYTDSE